MANIYQNLWILLSTTVVKAITKKKIIAPVSGSKNTSIEGIIVKINIFNINKICNYEEDKIQELLQNEKSYITI